MGKIYTFFIRYQWVFLIAFAVLLFILYGTLSIVRHMHFQSGGFDLGLYDQAVWRFSQFLDPYNTIKDRIIFGDHMVLTLPLLGPLFYLWDDVRMLLVIQAIAVAVSAIPIYLIALKRTRSIISAWTVTILYSLFYGIQFGVFFDFHPILLGVSLLAFLAWSLEYGKKKLFVLFFILCLLTQENMGLSVACVGIIYFFRKEYRKISVVMMVLGLLYGFIAMKASAQFSPIGYQYMPEIPRSIPDFFIRLFDSEEKRLTWLYSYSWFSFLPLFSPGSIVAVVTDLSQYYATGESFSRMWSPFMHHRAILSVFLTLGLLDVLSVLSRWKRISSIVCCVLLIGSFTCQYKFHFALNKLTKAEYWKEEPWMNDTRALISLVPKNGSVATQQNLVPHLSHRKEIYLVYPRQHDIKEMPCGQSLCWWLDFPGKPDYLVVDTRPNQWLTQILEINENWLSAISNMEKVGKITLEKQVGNAKMYRIEK